MEPSKSNAFVDMLSMPALSLAVPAMLGSVGAVALLLLVCCAWLNVFANDVQRAHYEASIEGVVLTLHDYIVFIVTPGYEMAALWLISIAAIAWGGKMFVDYSESQRNNRVS